MERGIYYTVLVIITVYGITFFHTVYKRGYKYGQIDAAQGNCSYKQVTNTVTNVVWETK